MEAKKSQVAEKEAKKGKIIELIEETFVVPYQEQIRILEGQDLGVETLKNVTTDIFKIAAVATSLAKEFSYDKLFAMLEVFGRYENFSATAGKAVAEIKDLDPEEAQEVYNHATAVFDIEDNQKEAKFERLFYLPVLSYKEVLETRDAVRDVRNILKSDMNWVGKASALSDMSTSLFNQGRDVVGVALEYYMAITDLFEEGTKVEAKLLPSG